MTLTSVLNRAPDPNVSSFSHWYLPDHDHDASTPLEWSVEFGRRDLIKLLLDRGADPKEHSHYALHLAAESGQKEVVKLLLKRGAESDKKRGRGDQTPLHRAAENGHKGSMGLLVCAGANPFARDGDGNSVIGSYRRWHSRNRFGDSDGELPLLHRLGSFCILFMLGCAWGIIKCCSCSLRCCIRKCRDKIRSCYPGPSDWEMDSEVENELFREIEELVAQQNARQNRASGWTDPGEAHDCTMEVLSQLVPSAIIRPRQRITIDLLPDGLRGNDSLLEMEEDTHEDPGPGGGDWFGKCLSLFRNNNTAG